MYFFFIKYEKGNETRISLNAFWGGIFGYMGMQTVTHMRSFSFFFLF